MTARPRFDLGRWMPALAPLALAVVFAILGRPVRTGLLVGVALLMAILVAVGVPVARWIERAVVAVVHAIGAVLLGAGFLLVAAPLWAWRSLRGQHGFPGAVSGWTRTTAGTGEPQELGSAPTRDGISLTSRALAAIGLVILLLAIDYGIGWAWDKRYPTEPLAEVAASVQSVATKAPDVPSTLPPDPRTATDAMASSPWAAAYFADLRGQTFGYWPFTADRPEDYATPYINVEDWVRRSWEPPSTAGAPAVWFFGGSAMFGEGQRDAHTVPSEVARLAAADGLPIVARNYGQRGWVHMQEAMLYEQQLALHNPPALSVFYDGPNDLQAAAMFRDAIPTDLHADEYSEILHNTHIDSSQLAGPPPPESLDIWEAYTEHSAVRKVAGWLGLTATPAGAEASLVEAGVRPGQAGGGDGSGDGSSVRNSDGNVIWGTVEDGEQGLEIYDRARSLTRYLSRTHEVAPTYFWQPVATHQDAVGYAREHLPKSVIDLSDVFDDADDPLYIDTTHTNEAGARLVAEAMWKRLRPQVQQWYRDHP